MAAHWQGGNGGKGSDPRPLGVSLETFDANHTLAFGDKSAEKARKAKEKADYFARLAAETKARMSDNTGTAKDEFQDVLSTEDALLGDETPE